MRFILISILFSALFLKIQAQSPLKHKWVLMSIDNLMNGIKKPIGEYVIAELIFDTDSTYHGTFCNAYNGKVKFNDDKTCKMSAPDHAKRQCMGYSDVETELFRLYPLVTRYVLKNQLLFLFTSEQKRLLFKYE